MSTRLAGALGALLTAARGPKSRRALAAELGVADPTLLAYEHGEANPTLAKVEALAAQYGIEVDVVLREQPALSLSVDDLLLIADALRHYAECGDASRIDGDQDAAARICEALDAGRVKASGGVSGHGRAEVTFYPAGDSA